MPVTKTKEVEQAPGKVQDAEIVEDGCASCKTGKCGCKKCKTKRSRGVKRLGVADKNDALTPQEYLAACDLGVQGRSRSYIRARLDVSTKTGLPGKKCGGSHIAASATCHNGKPPRKSTKRATYKNINEGLKAGPNDTRGEKIAQGAGKATRAAGILVGGLGLVTGNFNKFASGYALANAGNAAISGAAASRASRAGETELAEVYRMRGARASFTALALGAVTPGLGKAAYGGAKSAARGAGIASGNVYRGAKSAAFNVEQSTRGFKKMKRRPSRKSSSLAIWADGFSSPTTGELL